MKENKYLSVQMLGEYIHFSKSYIYKMVGNNSIPHIKLGTRTLFERELIDKWVKNGGRMDSDLPQLPKL
ncbi:MAG: excisionase family DNA-binding protein [Sphingobacteriia bacterium]|nr:excisionase family DNA-binding protein [Sphingobacteriia bacterium]